jgi:hypothetical protein
MYTDPEKKGNNTSIEKTIIFEFILNNSILDISRI